MLIVPGQGIGIGSLRGFSRRTDPLTVKGIVMPAVFKLLLDAAADLEVKIGRDRHIAGVEQAVDVAPQQKAVPGLMFSAVAIGSYMRRLKRRQGPLLRDRAAPPVNVGHQHTECALPEAGPDEMGLPEPRLPFRDAGERLPAQTVVDRLPQGQSLGFSRCCRS